MTERGFKPNLKWLEKVAGGQVYSTFSYSARNGGRYGFVGGKKTYEKHRDAGFVNWCPGASLGRPGVLTLTQKGVDALSGTPEKSK